MQDFKRAQTVELRPVTVPAKDVLHASDALAGATVELTRVQPEPVLTFHSSADGRGRFHFDSLPVGEYALHVTSPLLDSLQLALPDRAVTVAEGRRARIEVAMSAGAALRDAVCPGLTLGPGRGAVTGHTTDADTEQDRSRGERRKEKIRALGRKGRAQ